jgi:dihydroflavonol-4-reductase
MIVVTGATGFAGNALLRRLAELRAGDDSAASEVSVRAIVRAGRDTSSIAGLAEIAEGDIQDRDSLVKAFRGAEVVFHLAGEVSISTRGFERLRKINVEGTRNVIEACKTAGVRRLVYTSSVHAFVEPPKGSCLDEDSPIDPVRTIGPYSKSKAEATQLVFAAARSGLDAVVTYPSAIIGPYDHRPSRLGQVIISTVRRRLGAYVDGGYNFVDCRDLADGLVAAWKRGRAGEGYILCGNTVTVKQLLETIETASGVPAPRLKLNFRFVRSVSRLIPVYYWITRQMPLFTTYALDVLQSNCDMSCEKAKRELGYSPRPLRETIVDSIAWFKEQGML